MLNGKYDDISTLECSLELLAFSENKVQFAIEGTNVMFVYFL